MKQRWHGYSHYCACCLPVLRSAGWETISPKLLMCVVSRHRVGVYVSTLVPQDSCHLGMFIIATLQVGKLRFTGADPGPKASLSDSGDWIHSSLSLCLNSLCMRYCERTSGEPDLLSFRIQSTREYGPNLYNSRNSFLSLNKGQTHIYDNVHWKLVYMCILKTLSTVFAECVLGMKNKIQCD